MSHYPVRAALALHLIETTYRSGIRHLRGAAKSRRTSTRVTPFPIFTGPISPGVRCRSSRSSSTPIIHPTRSRRNAASRWAGRCRVQLQLGREIMRVGVFASGGLSHFIVDEELDRAVSCKALSKMTSASLARLDPKRLQAGSSEIRGWICAAAASAAAGPARRNGSSIFPPTARRP